MNKNILVVISSILLSGLTAFAVVKVSEPEMIETHYSSDGQVVKAVNLSLSDYPDFTFAAESCVEAVVYVKVTQKTQQQVVDPFSFFFGFPQSQTREREVQGSGSGVIIRSDGYIVTNNHVVSGASSIEVTLNNNKTYAAKVIGTDPATDVALIKIEAEGLPSIPFGNSDELRLGEWVLAIGSPLGEELRSTITAGIVSAKGRSMPNYDGQFKIESFIQTDAAVNPGNSGGVLVNKEGELIGINTAIVSNQTGQYIGYAFAVPSNIVKKIVNDLIDFGSVKRVKLGVTMSAVDNKTAQDNKMQNVSGVLVHDIVKGSAADRAGVKMGDIIVAIDSTYIKSPSVLQEKINGFHPGDKAVITVIRNSKQQKLDVEFTEDDELGGNVEEDGSVVFYGASLKAGDNGVEVVSAGNGKFAAAGGTDGFVIMYVNEKRVTKPEEVIAIAKSSKRSIFIEGKTSDGRPGYFGFGKDN